jgi:polyisoprenoid-binding protein YceI
MSSTTASSYATSPPSASTAASAAHAWDIDASHSSASFKVRHLMVSHVRGELGPISGTVSIDDQDVTRSRIDVSIDASKIATRDDKRDEHLRSADFLDVANHPTVTFKSTRVERAGGDELRVIGDLTIRGTTRPVTLTVESLAAAVSDPWGNTKRGATARAKINRKDWGLAWNVGLEAGGVLVGEDVAIELEVELLKRKQA